VTTNFVERNLNALAATAMVITWSSGFIGAELAARAHANPTAFLGWRFSILAVILLSYAHLRGVNLRDTATWRRQFLIGTLNQAGYLIFVYEAVDRGIHGGTAALIAALQPLLVATVATRLLGDRTSSIMWIGMFIGLGGVAIVVSGDIGVAKISAWNYALPTAGMLSLTIGTVLSKKLKPADSLLQSVAMQSTAAAVLLMIGAAVTGHLIPPATIGFWQAIAWVVILPSLGGYFFYLYVNKHLGPTVLSTLLYLTPPTTMAWVYLMFGTPMSLLSIVGLAVSALGVALVLFGRSRLQAS
jgi:drug/metabolite transporter (DMT)-like permease